MSRHRKLYNWIRDVARGEAPPLLASGHKRRNAASRDREAGSLARISPELRADIVRGRAELARASFASTSSHSHIGERRDEAAITRLLELLWHEDENVRRAAAHALPGGDHQRAHVPHFGHFVGAFLRNLAEAETGHTSSSPLSEHSALSTAAERYDCVEAALRVLLVQNIGEIRGMSNMNYSFLSSALYLAVLATCRDVLLSLRRLRCANAQAELCSLLWNLSQMSVLRCLNGQDLETLARLACETLADLPPDHIPDFWHSLSHASPPRRLAVAPALQHFHDTRAVPHLLDALKRMPRQEGRNNRDAAQGGDVAPLVIACLGQLEDARALPDLEPFAASRDRQTRAAALSAIAAIQRANRKHPSRTLLRATRDSSRPEDSETMLRSAPVNSHNAELSGELLRQTGSDAPDVFGVSGERRHE